MVANEQRPGLCLGESRSDRGSPRVTHFPDTKGQACVSLRLNRHHKSPGGRACTNRITEAKATPMASERPHQYRPPRPSRLEAFQVICVMLVLVVVPAALTLQTVSHPGRLEMTSANPTPLGYTISLSLFVV